MKVVFGTSGNDTFTSTPANETFVGRGGNDTFVFTGNFGKDTILDFQASNDVLQLDHNTFANYSDVLAHAAQVGSDVVIAADAQHSITLAQHRALSAHPQRFPHRVGVFGLKATAGPAIAARRALLSLAGDAGHDGAGQHAKMTANVLF